MRHPEEQPSGAAADRQAGVGIVGSSSRRPAAAGGIELREVGAVAKAPSNTQDIAQAGRQGQITRVAWSGHYWPRR